ncbi:MAG: hypothetical protein ABIP48_03595 [Planctomycetota bacterium]
MKTVSIPPQATEVNALLEQARDDDILVRMADGTEFMVTVIDEFDEEVGRTRQNAKLMALLEERAKQEQTVPLADVMRQLGLSE